MARVRKPQPMLDATFFSTPEQRMIRFLMSEPTTIFTPRVISSKLKGVRGLGGVEGIEKILTDFEELGMVEFLNNRKSVRLIDEHPAILLLKTFTALCDLEGLKALLEPITIKAVLFGSRSTGRFRSDSDYDLYIVSDVVGEVRKIVERHPLGKQIELVAWTSAENDELESRDPVLAAKVARGIVLWGRTW